MKGRTDIPFQCQVWDQERALLEGMVAILPEGSRVVNIGAWAGCSTVPMLRGSRDIGDFHLYSIDLEPRPEEMEYALECGLADPIRFTQICGDSKIVGQNWQGGVHLVFVDGDHSQCLEDIQAWEPHIFKDGYLIIHDYEAFLPAVTEAVDDWFREAVLRGWCKTAKVDTIVAFRRGWPHPCLADFPDSLPMKFARGEA